LTQVVRLPALTSALAVLASNKAVPARFETQIYPSTKASNCWLFSCLIAFDGEMPLLMARDRTATEPAALLQRWLIPITGKV